MRVIYRLARAGVVTLPGALEMEWSEVAMLWRIYVDDQEALSLSQ